MTRSPHTIGLDVASPGIAVFQRTLTPLDTFQSETAPCPSATPEAFAPRNAGHGSGLPRVAVAVGRASFDRRRRAMHHRIRRGRRRISVALALVAKRAIAPDDRHPLDDPAAPRKRDAHLRRIVCHEPPLVDGLQPERGLTVSRERSALLR